MLTTPDSFRQHYQSLVSSGTIERDAAQARIAEAFAALEQRLAGYKPARKHGLLGRLFARPDQPAVDHFHGKEGVTSDDWFEDELSPPPAPDPTTTTSASMTAPVSGTWGVMCGDWSVGAICGPG